MTSKSPIAPLAIRKAKAADLPELSALCLRSKGHWGYDEAFLDMCREELTLREADLASSDVFVAHHDETITGMAQIAREPEHFELDKLFVEPDWIGCGVGGVLFKHVHRHAKRHNARSMMLTADPFAAPFYEKLGFERIGDEPSSSIPGRTLGRYRLSL